MDTERHTDITENYNCHTNGIYECNAAGHASM